MGSHPTFPHGYVNTCFSDVDLLTCEHWSSDSSTDWLTDWAVDWLRLHSHWHETHEYRLWVIHTSETHKSGAFTVTRTSRHL